MIVPKPQVRLILSDKKRVHRVPVTRIVKTGRPVSVRSHHTGPAECRIIVTGMERQRLGDVTGVQALEEGHRTLDDFKVAWVEAFDRPYMNAQAEQIANDGLPEDEGADFLRALEIGRFDRIHAYHDAWILRFVLDREDRPRFLAARSEELYVSSPSRAMPGEPEALDELEQARQAKQSSERWAKMRAEKINEDRAKSSARRVREQSVRAARFGVDIGPELDRIDAVLDEIERKSEAA